VFRSSGWVVSGLDLRFGWGPPVRVEIQVGALYGDAPRLRLDGLGDAGEPLFFSATVRIQTDRGHTVVSSGPYRFVRHPGYLERSFSS